MFQINLTKIFEGILKTMLAGGFMFALHFLSNIVTETTHLNENFIQMRSDLNTSNEKQSVLNVFFGKRLDAHDERLKYIERKGK